MAITPQPSEESLLGSSVAAVKNFSATSLVHCIRLTNTSGSTVTGVYIYADYTGTSTGDAQVLVENLSLLAGESVVVDGAVFTFASGGRLSGVAGTANVISCHLSFSTHS
jgi:hypothetical protein